MVDLQQLRDVKNQFYVGSLQAYRYLNAGKRVDAQLQTAMRNVLSLTRSCRHAPTADQVLAVCDVTDRVQESIDDELVDTVFERYGPEESYRAEVDSPLVKSLEVDSAFDALHSPSAGLLEDPEATIRYVGRVLRHADAYPQSNIAAVAMDAVCDAYTQAPSHVPMLVKRIVAQNRDHYRQEFATYDVQQRAPCVKARYVKRVAADAINAMGVLRRLINDHVEHLTAYQQQVVRLWAADDHEADTIISAADKFLHVSNERLSTFKTARLMKTADEEQRINTLARELVRIVRRERRYLHQVLTEQA